jgi:putative redox protein
MTQETVKAAMLAAIGRIQSDTSAAKLVFRADTELVEDVKCTAQVRKFPPITIDEPPQLGGGDAGPNPVEAVLVALGTCQEVVYSAYASVMGIKLDRVQCNLRGNLDLRGLFGMDPDIPPGFQKITYEMILESSADRESLQQLVRTVESHCPVLDTLRRPVEVIGSVKINGATEAARSAAE